MEFNVFRVDAAGMLTGICDLGGGNWGSTMVYNQFIAFLYKVFGKSAVDGLEKSESYDLKREFTYKALSVRPLSDKVALLNMKIPNGLSWIRDVDRDRQRTEQGLQNDIYFIADKMRFTHKKMLEFHEESLATIGNHLDKIFSTPSHTGISTVIMVGEYAESQILQDFITKRFSSKKLIVSNCAREAFLKGAVQFAF